eukprot:Pgem_evm1s13681
MLCGMEKEGISHKVKGDCDYKRERQSTINGVVVRLRLKCDYCEAETTNNYDHKGS